MLSEGRKYVNTIDRHLTPFTIAIPDDIERPQGFFRILMQ
jgi:hypothetical protein